MVPWRLNLLLLLAVVVSSLDVAAAQVRKDHKLFEPYCSNDTDNYVDNSQYRQNLISLLGSLSRKAISDGGFSNDTAGDAPDKVFGLLMCFVDRSWKDCQDCLNAATSTVIATCPHSRQLNGAADTCLIRYSNQSFSVPNISAHFSVLYKPELDASDTATMTDTRQRLMTRLAEQAADSKLLFKNGTEPYKGPQLMYGLAQCTRDLPPSECKRCLTNYIKLLPQILPNYHGGELKGYSCYVRYDLAPFDITPPPPPLLR